MKEIRGLIARNSPLLKRPTREILRTILVVSLLLPMATQGLQGSIQSESSFGYFTDDCSQLQCHEVNGTVSGVSGRGFLDGFRINDSTAPAFVIGDLQQFAANQTPCAKQNVLDQWLFGFESVAAEENGFNIRYDVDVRGYRVAALAPSVELSVDFTREASFGFGGGTGVSGAVQAFVIDAGSFGCSFECGAEGFAGASVTEVPSSQGNEQRSLWIVSFGVFCEPCFQNLFGGNNWYFDFPGSAFKHGFHGVQSAPVATVSLDNCVKPESGHFACPHPQLNSTQYQEFIASACCGGIQSTQFIRGQNLAAGIFNERFPLLEREVPAALWSAISFEVPSQELGDLHLPLKFGAGSQGPVMELRFVFAHVCTFGESVLSNGSNNVLASGFLDGFASQLFRERNQDVTANSQAILGVRVAFFVNEIRDDRPVFFVLNDVEPIQLELKAIRSDGVCVCSDKDLLRHFDGSLMRKSESILAISILDSDDLRWRACFIDERSSDSIDSEMVGNLPIRKNEVLSGSISKLEENLPEAIITLRLSTNSVKQKRGDQIDLSAVPEHARTRVKKAIRNIKDNTCQLIITLSKKQEEALRESGFQIEIPFNKKRSEIEALLREQRKEFNGEVIVIIYVRVSTKEQSKKKSLLENLELQLAKAAQLNFTVGGIVFDVGSGEDAERQGLREMMEFVQNHFVFGIMVPCIDRFYRSVRHGLEESFALDDSGTVLIYGEDYEDESSDMALWSHRRTRRDLIRGLERAEDELSKLKTRVTMSIRARLKEGQLIWKKSLASILYEAIELDDNGAPKLYIQRRKNQLKILIQFNKRLSRFVHQKTEPSKTELLEWCCRVSGKDVSLDTLFYEFEMGWADGLNRAGPKCHQSKIVECRHLAIPGAEAALAETRKLLNQIPRPAAHRTKEKLVGWNRGLIDMLLFNELQEDAEGALRLALVCVKDHAPTLVEFRENANYEDHEQVLFVCPACTDVTGIETRVTFLQLTDAYAIDSLVGKFCRRCVDYSFVELEDEFSWNSNRLAVHSCLGCHDKFAVRPEPDQPARGRRQSKAEKLELNSGVVGRAHFELLLKVGLGERLSSEDAQTQILGELAKGKVLQALWGNSRRALVNAIKIYNKQNPCAKVRLESTSGVGKNNPDFWLESG